MNNNSKQAATALAATLAIGAAVGTAVLTVGQSDAAAGSEVDQTPISTASPFPTPLGRQIRQGSVSGSNSGGTSPASHGGTASPVKASYSTSYALLADVWQTGPTRFALSYDRVDLLTGAAAKAYYRQHPELETADWAVRNVNPMLRQLPVATGATLLGGPALGGTGGSALHRISGRQLVAGVQAHPRSLVKITERVVGNHREVTRVVEGLPAVSRGARRGFPIIGAMTGNPCAP